MLVKKLNASVLDVFVGVGWEHWSRFKLENRQLKLVSGKPLSKDQYNELRHIVFAGR